MRSSMVIFHRVREETLNGQRDDWRTLYALDGPDVTIKGTARIIPAARVFFALQSGPGPLHIGFMFQQQAQSAVQRFLVQGLGIQQDQRLGPVDGFAEARVFLEAKMRTPSDEPPGLPC